MFANAPSCTNRDFKIRDSAASRTQLQINGLGLERRRLRGKSKVKIPEYFTVNSLLLFCSFVSTLGTQSAGFLKIEFHPLLVHSICPSK